MDRNIKEYIEELYEVNLPPYLENDIKQFIKGIEEDDNLLDCYWCELYASINSAEQDEEITEEQANYLRKKYLY